MQIILLHPRWPARTLTLTSRHVLLIGLLLFTTVIGGAWSLYYVTVRQGMDISLPFIGNALAATPPGEAMQKDKYVKENIAAMAVKLGEMQAQMMRLDALGERVQGLAGVRPEEFNFKQPPGRGGAEPSSKPDHTLGMAEFQQALDAMARDLEHRADYMNVVETALINDKVKFKLLPTVQPVNVAYNASGFGWRIDPFTGRSAFHEGIDFAAPVGTHIMAAAGGVVITAEYHHQFGNVLEIDHGNDIVTRYAHTSRILAKVGDIVKRGQYVADIGTTGRSTGPHLHFEVLVKGIQQDPHKFLSAGAAQAKVVAQAAK